MQESHTVNGNLRPEWSGKTLYFHSFKISFQFLRYYTPVYPSGLNIIGLSFILLKYFLDIIKQLWSTYYLVCFLFNSPP